jgi:hypothetical protein
LEDRRADLGVSAVGVAAVRYYSKAIWHLLPALLPVREVEQGGDVFCTLLAKDVPEAGE